MFEQADGHDDKVRTRILIVLSGVGVALIIGAIALFGAYRSSAPPPDAPRAPQGLPDAKHAGDPEFDKNIGLVTLTEKTFYTQANMLGQRQALMKGKILNFNDKPVVGIELRANVLGANGKVMATTIAMPVPKRFEQVPARGSVEYSVTVDGVPDGEIEDMTIDVVGLVMGQ
jgi:hypothetical protein